jgi:CubicO group peptidase (beta-lactamase class C family)
MAIMMLVERGKLRYDDSLAKFFPEFPPYAQRITVRNLLNHTSGLPDYEAIFVRDGRVSGNWPRSIHEPHDSYEPTAIDALHLLERQPNLLFEPGTKWSYSNSGYMVLGQIIEKISGERYREFMRKEIFRPSGMTSSEVYDETSSWPPNSAASYTQDGTVYKNIDYTPVSLIYGEGNIFSTLEDMYRWDQALYGDKLVKQSTVAQAFTPARLKDGTLTDYGFGWGIEDCHGVPCYEHSGGWLGFRTFIRRYPALRFTVVVASNLAQVDTEALADKVAELYLRDQQSLQRNLE